MRAFFQIKFNSCWFGYVIPLFRIIDNWLYSYSNYVIAIGFVDNDKKPTSNWIQWLFLAFSFLSFVEIC